MRVTASWNRSIIKAFSWRVIATLTTIVIAYLITGRIDIALEIGVLEFFFKIMVYAMHEKVWEKITFGLKLEPIKKKGNKEKNSSANKMSPLT
ncbi:hypothetical protein MNBD_NITROSPINAE01-87 [hydrothermal vent metagenome]|uniref:DUF2061 domain-containing protein n=1 Tax=hydrothermal vent metagenome TaxID=652676 RepID=A0A3B1C3Z3_9ZZZZ